MFEQSRKAAWTLAGDLAQGKRLGVLCQFCRAGAPQRHGDLNLWSLDCSLRKKNQSGLDHTMEGCHMGWGMSSSPGERELKTPRKPVSEERGWSWNSVEVHELCVSSPCTLLFPKEGPQSYSPVYWERVSSVAARNPSGGSGEGTKQASIRGKRCPIVISPGPAPVDKVDMGGALSCRGRMGSEGTHCSAGNQLHRKWRPPPQVGRD